MQVGLGLFVGRVVLAAVLASALLPALALMADLPGRDNVLPLDAFSPLGILARYIAAGREVDPVAVVLAATIKLRGLPGVELPGDFLGFGEGAGRLGLGR